MEPAEPEVVVKPEVIVTVQSHPANVINYKEKKISCSYNCQDETMNDSDCSEDYNNDPYFQQSGQAYFKSLEQAKKEQMQETLIDAN